ncbi:cucumisin [Artemisia annua]|uniref:Cucumisin n=1 Tax=Artemisia annua TaxID=35608 RepID=A0A2U1P2T1_ARTAN|nr:cucumisin [Artemisia annua]
MLNGFNSTSNSIIRVLPDLRFSRERSRDVAVESEEGKARVLKGIGFRDQKRNRKNSWQVRCSSWLERNDVEVSRHLFLTETNTDTTLVLGKRRRWRTTKKFPLGRSGSPYANKDVFVRSTSDKICIWLPLTAADIMHNSIPILRLAETLKKRSAVLQRNNWQMQSLFQAISDNIQDNRCSLDWQNQRKKEVQMQVFWNGHQPLTGNHNIRAVAVERHGSSAWSKPSGNTTATYAAWTNHEGARHPLPRNHTYIVYMGDIPKISIPVSSVHISILQKVIGSRASKSLLRSYTRSFSGFVARLTEDEKNQIARLKGVVSVFPNGVKQLHTTRSWDFMGFPQDVARAPLESDIIVGMLDTGVWPESDSFKDDGFGPPPSRWRGSCDSNNFTCNNKLIGARYYNTEALFTGDELSARDTDGHGTHTASTVAGRAVNGASLLGLANGTARGGVPSARIAVYKICFTTCQDSDILAAFDDAIADGVDIISLSVGGPNPHDYFEDPIAIGAFHAMKNNILTSSSAGNSGPSLGSTSSVSPWLLSVAASSIDRKFLTQIVLGNSQTYMGPAINTFDGAVYSIVYGASVPNTMNGSTSTESRFCKPNSLDPILVKDKIVVCKSFSGPENALLSGASGVVIEGDLGREDRSLSYPIPTTYLNSEDGDAVLSYINSTSKPTASILKSIEPVDVTAPTVGSFSSRGPNLITLDILKPDLTAPGVDILAAWSQDSTVTGIKGDTRVVPYNIISGTSMSCPHATGAAAYIKSFHNDWSPAAIKSALMTTATPMSPTKNNDAEFAYGSGHINPLKAVDPGLIYDAGEADYVSFLCGQGYDAIKLIIVTGDITTCSAANNATVWDLNYPSFALSSNESGIIVRMFNRIVTNVGLGESTYQANVFSPSGLVVDVSPSTLVFTTVGEKQSFLVTVTATIGSQMLSGSLVWNDGVHNVTSPIVAFPS